jgi:hypothetical protein
MGRPSPLEVTINGVDGGVLIAGLTAGSSTVFTLVGFDNQHSDNTAAFFGCTAGYDAVTTTGVRTQTQTSGESLAVISLAPLATVAPADLKTWNGTAWVYETAADILTKLLTVDGAGSGLNADLLDGHDTSYFVPEAASDNVQYARKNAAWEEVVQQVYGTIQNYMFNASISTTRPTMRWRSTSRPTSSTASMSVTHSFSRTRIR